jgi:hypothetical protein
MKDNLQYSEKIAKAIATSRQATLEMEASGLQLETVISLIESNIKKNRRRTVRSEIKTT